MFLSLAIGGSTRQTYSSGINSYLSFLDFHELHPAFPASIATLCLWVSAASSYAGDLQGVSGRSHHSAH